MQEEGGVLLYMTRHDKGGGGGGHVVHDIMLGKKIDKIDKRTERRVKQKKSRPMV